MASGAEKLKKIHSSINNHKHCTKYELIPCELTHIKHLKLDPLTLKPHRTS